MLLSRLWKSLQPPWDFLASYSSYELEVRPLLAPLGASCWLSGVGGRRVRVHAAHDAMSEPWRRKTIHEKRSTSISRGCMSLGISAETGHVLYSNGMMDTQRQRAGRSGSFFGLRWRRQLPVKAGLQALGVVLSCFAWTWCTGIVASRSFSVSSLSLCISKVLHKRSKRVISILAWATCCVSRDSNSHGVQLKYSWAERLKEIRASM